MFRKVAIILLPICLLTAVGLMIREDSRSGVLTPAATKRARSYQPGDTVVVVSKKAGLQIGRAVIATVPTGATMTVVEVNGDWVGGTLAIDGVSHTGWISMDAVALAKTNTRTAGQPARASGSSAHPAGASANARTDETAAKLAAKHAAKAAAPARSGTTTKRDAARDLSGEWQRVLAKMKQSEASGVPADGPAPKPSHTPKTAARPVDQTSSKRASPARQETVDTEGPNPTDASPKVAPTQPIRASATQLPSAAARRAAPADTVAKPPASAQPKTEEEVDIQLFLAQTIDQIEQLDRAARIGQLTLVGDQFTDRSLKYVNGRRLHKLSIEATSVTNSSLKYIQQVRGLRYLRLWSPRFSDGALTHIAMLKELEILDLEGSGIEGERLDQLARLPKLHMLVLGPLTQDSVLEKLAALQALDQLDLRACKRLTEASFAQLAKLRNLKQLWLPPQIARQGRRQLRRQLPDCQVR